MLLRKAGLNDVIVKRSITVKPTTTLLEARDILFKHKIRRLIVLGAKDKPVGIITEKDVTKTDLVSVFLTQATKPLKVSDIMTRNVITVTPSDSVLLVESLLINNRITRIVVERKRRPVGIITHRNFLPAKIPHWIAETADPQELERYQKGHQLMELQTNQLSYLLPFKAVDIMTSN